MIERELIGAWGALVGVLEEPLGGAWGTLSVWSAVGLEIARTFVLLQ